MKRVYVSYPMTSTKHDLNQIQDVLLKANVYPSIPPAGQLNSKTKGALFDKYLIDNSDELWAFGQFGRDVCWEIGYAVGLGKPVKIFIDQKNKYIIEQDWMLLLQAEIVMLEEA